MFINSIYKVSIECLNFSKTSNNPLESLSLIYWANMTLLLNTKDTWREGEFEKWVFIKVLNGSYVHVSLISKGSDWEYL